MADTPIHIQLAIVIAGADGYSFTPADFEKPFDPNSIMARYVRLGEAATPLVQRPGKQFPTFVETIIDAIDFNEGGMTDQVSVEAGLRAVVGNADAVFWAAEEAFFAGHKACLDVTVPATAADPEHVPNVLALWAAYDPSERVVGLVQEMGA